MSTVIIGSCRFAIYSRRRILNVCNIEQFLRLEESDNLKDCHCRHLRAIMYLIEANVFSTSWPYFLEFYTPHFEVRRRWYETKNAFIKRLKAEAESKISCWLTEQISQVKRLVT